MRTAAHDLQKLGQCGDRLTEGIIVLQYMILIGALSQIWQTFFPHYNSDYVLYAVFLIEITATICVSWLYNSYRKALAAAKQSHMQIKSLGGKTLHKQK
jgi:hypothetical protein